MKRPFQFVVTLHDLRTFTAVEQTFSGFPITLGRGPGNALRLDAGSVSRHHGVFAHEKGSPISYMDLGSKNGTFVDGVQIEPLVPIRLRDSNVVTINPFDITFHLLRGEPRADRRTTAPLELPSAGPPGVSLWTARLARSEAIRELRRAHSPSDLFRRAVDVVDVLAETVVLYRGNHSIRRSVLTSSAGPDEIIAYLLSPIGGDRPLRDLRDLLIAMFSPPPHSSAPS